MVGQHPGGALAETPACVECSPALFAATRHPATPSGSWPPSHRLQHKCKRLPRPTDFCSKPASHSASTLRIELPMRRSPRLPRTQAPSSHHPSSSGGDARRHAIAWRSRRLPCTPWLPPEQECSLSSGRRTEQPVT